MGAATNSEPESELFLHRRIEFQLSTRRGFVNNNCTNGFKLVTLNPNTDPPASGMKSENSLDRELSFAGVKSENRFDPELSFEITFRRIGAGLRNLGNTCFLNSVLQCLTYTEPLAAYLQSGKHQNSCRTSGFCALCAIQKHVSRALQSSGRILEPKDLVSNLRCSLGKSLTKRLGISRSFRNARQEDAHEYMVNLLESMHKCCLPSGVPSESPGAYEKSLVHKIFGGRLRSQVKCMQCSYCSDKFDPFLDLSLEIVRADSLLKALGHFTAKEQLDGGAKQYQCQQCKHKVKALKQLTIHQAPHVLTVHLKRFSAHAPGRKIDNKIAFGPTLDLKPFVTGPYDGGLQYTLYGVLVHAGWSTHSGHYYCFVRTSSGMWHSLDDNQVYQVSEKKVLEQKAYMLFYVRDRKNFVTTKPVDIIPRANFGNAAYSKLNLESKEKIQNSTIEKKTDGPSSAILSAVKETPHQKIPFQNGNGPISVDSNLGHKSGAQTEHSSVVPSSKDPLKAHSTVNTNLSDAAKIASVVEDQNAPVVKLPDSIVPEESLQKKEPIGSCKIDRSNSEMCDNKIMPMENKIKPMDTVAEASNKVINVKSSQNCIESQAGGSSGKAVDSTIEENHENGQATKALQPGLLSNPPPTTQHSSHVEIKKKLPELKAKRKHFKYQVATTSMRPNIIFGVGLSIRKMKHKRRKVQKKSPNLKHASDLVPSSTDKLSPLLNGDDKKHNVKEHVVSGEDSISSDVINNEFRKRVVDATAFPAEKQPEKNQPVAQGPNPVNRQMNVMSMLTRGLEEATVARWDGIAVSRSENFEMRAAGPANIGYVGDDWDEEYDRGKRKKLRGPKISFDGPNLFQEVATKKSKLKRAKLNRVENQPFTI
ncbi:hypothetical protein CASFOL_026835 [Castilleja foliolosa]|uniref:Ubiquitin carboxyl-terminal hydrolase n=1 Tax=Castilleja foliolosa TaxID=1961234 RepID=A0ABD3CJ08_9LAMI